MSLAAKTCLPCKGGVDPLSRADAERYLSEIPGWQLSEDGRRIHREYKFKNFVQALAFVNKVGELAEREAHHPEIRFGWGHAQVELWTHKINGLHENDFIVAAKIDQAD
ncbi:MAG: 4a-hydroxytetrahydrobiopterin dehydratase [Nitrococcus mobilis]|nr:4a-hydroxytetrahydrobiopterin dehydratase [Nitrococcus mobilis]